MIFSRGTDEHVRLDLQRLLENKLHVKAEKCEFHVPTVSFLDFVVEKGQLKADPIKAQAIAEWPIPSTHPRGFWVSTFIEG